MKIEREEEKKKKRKMGEKEEFIGTEKREEYGRNAGKRAPLLT